MLKVQRRPSWLLPLWSKTTRIRKARKLKKSKLDHCKVAFSSSLPQQIQCVLKKTTFNLNKSWFLKKKRPLFDLLSWDCFHPTSLRGVFFAAFAFYLATPLTEGHPRFHPLNTKRITTPCDWDPGLFALGCPRGPDTYTISGVSDALTMGSQGLVGSDEFLGPFFGVPKKTLRRFWCEFFFFVSGRFQNKLAKTQKKAFRRSLANFDNFFVCLARNQQP